MMLDVVVVESAEFDALFSLCLCIPCCFARLVLLYLIYIIYINIILYPWYDKPQLRGWAKQSWSFKFFLVLYNPRGKIMFLVWASFSFFLPAIFSEFSELYQNQDSYLAMRNCVQMTVAKGGFLLITHQIDIVISRRLCDFVKSIFIYLFHFFKLHTSFHYF